MRHATLPLVVLLITGCAAGTGSRAENASPAASAPPAGWTAKPAEHGQPQLRAVVSDSASGDIRVLDISAGTTVKKLAVTGPARLVPVGDETHVVLPQGDADVTNVLDAGIRWESHGDHSDPAHVSPRLVAGELKASKPTHVVPHGKHVSVFADGDGEAHVLHAGETKPEETVDAGRPHHGVAVELGGQVLASLPDSDKKQILPGGVQIIDDGTVVQKFDDCPRLHGEYAADNKTAIFGCSDGLLVLTKHGDRWRDSKIPNPRSAEKGERAGAFVGDGAESILGTFGDKAMISVDLKAKKIKRIALPAGLASYIWDPYWSRGVILTTDGRLHTIDAGGAIENSTKVIDPFTVSQDHNAPKPSIATGERAIYVTDPNTEKLSEVEVSDQGFQPGRSMNIGFVPLSIAVLGMTPLE